MIKLPSLLKTKEIQVGKAKLAMKWANLQVVGKKILQS